MKLFPLLLQVGVTILVTTPFLVMSAHPPDSSQMGNLIKTLLLNQEALSHTIQDKVTSDDLNASLIQTWNNIKEDIISRIDSQQSALQDTIKDTIKEEFIEYFNRTTNSGVENGVESGVDESNSRQEHLNERPVDCMGHRQNGITTSGVYEIYPISCSKPVNVWCDMESEDGGWTLFLSRAHQLVPENFSRSWDDYKIGFGNPSSEFWIGNDVLHALTRETPTILRVNAQDYSGNLKSGKWLQFSVGNLSNKYRLTVGQFQSTMSSLGDSLAYSNGITFTTIDQDNDAKASGNCAASNTGGGWWYRNCSHFTPTGIIKNTNSRSTSVAWHHWDPKNSKDASLIWLQFKIKPRDSQGPVRMCQAEQ